MFHLSDGRFNISTIFVTHFVVNIHIQQNNLNLTILMDKIAADIDSLRQHPSHSLRRFFEKAFFIQKAIVWCKKLTTLITNAN